MEYSALISNFDKMGNPIIINDFRNIKIDMLNCSRIYKNGIMMGSIMKCENYCSYFNLTKNSSNLEGNLKFLTMIKD